MPTSSSPTAGTWSIGGTYGSFDVNGATSFSTEPCARTTSAPMGALIGSLDGGTTWFRVGNGPTTLSGPGELLLGANDCPGPSGAYYADNTGSQAVTIGAPSAAAGNFAQNGSFEQGYPGDNVCGANRYSVGYACNSSNDSIPGWTQTGGGVDWHDNTGVTVTAFPGHVAPRSSEYCRYGSAPELIVSPDANAAPGCVGGRAAVIVMSSPTVGFVADWPPTAP